MNECTLCRGAGWIDMPDGDNPPNSVPCYKCSAQSELAHGNDRESIASEFCARMELWMLQEQQMKKDCVAREEFGKAEYHKGKEHAFALAALKTIWMVKPKSKP